MRPYIQRLNGTPIEQSFSSFEKRYFVRFSGGSDVVPTIIVVYVGSSINDSHLYSVKESQLKELSVLTLNS